jgi:hypothetical protein
MSDLFKLDWKDFFNGLFTAVVGPILAYLIVIFSELAQLALNGDPFKIIINWEVIKVVAIFSFLLYMSKRFFSGSQGTILGSK